MAPSTQISSYHTFTVIDYFDGWLVGGRLF